MESKSIVSDEEYDKLFSELVALETNHPEFASKTSPTQVVGSSLPRSRSGALVIEHSSPMLSLANAFSMEEVRAWDARIKRMSELSSPSYVAEIKYDGIALALHFEEGKFVRALTRGDGKSGEDATVAIKRLLPSVTRDLKGDWRKLGSKIEIRGEAYLTKEAFAQLNQEGAQKFTNARNVASGLLKRKAERLETDSEYLAQLSFIGYNLMGNGDEKLLEKATHEELIAKIKSLGLPTGEPYLRRLDTIDAFEELEREWASQRARLPFEADGLVIKLNERDAYARLGMTSHSPRWALAWKFSAKQATTTLKRIEMSVGRSGKITPVAILEPVRLAGVLISRATLHNKDYVEKNHFVTGCSVIVERSGDVIPRVVGRAETASDQDAIASKKSKSSSKSKDTTSASTSVHQGRQNEKNFETEEPDWTTCPCELKHPLTPQGNVDLVCTNGKCPPQMQRKLEHFCAALEIDGLGPASLKHLMEGGLISDFGDVFTLKEHSLAKLAMRDGWGEKKVQNLLAAIETARLGTSLSTLIFALGIPHVGKETAETLTTKIGSMEKLFEITAESLKNLEDVGPVVAESIADYFALPSTRNLVDSLKSAGLPMTFNSTQKKLHSLGVASGLHSNAQEPHDVNLLAGKSFVFTGAMETMTRKEAEALAKALGGKVKASITKDTTFLVEGKAPSSAKLSTTKANQARATGTTVISEAQFCAMIKRPFEPL